MDTPTSLHEQRLEAVIGVLRENAVASVIDLGCGQGFLLARLAGMDAFGTLAGADICPVSLRQAKMRLEQEHAGVPAHVCLFEASFTQDDARFSGYDAAVLLETIEHIEPDQLSKLENAVFGTARPALVVVTTPNRDYNALLGVPEHRMRHPDHRFEWGLQKFQSWCAGVATRNRYTVAGFRHIGGAHPALGGPTQMAVWRKAE
ncbi:MAG: methyltransferase domain-containing protein [Alphaproteobacteria bacterium]|jgi:3' terminal RNA ribose 2'-O-methyltransferase Hen1